MGDLPVIGCDVPEKVETYWRKRDLSIYDVT